ncbi:hypothetical protein HBN50_09115 [Halobacteriovorax sp. GB3]|uniref:hypothetical protein n=1 Tax=Halobacteriovorax sp. GB3 TaxID=2719615 RepID=UPI002360594A|nr:hypothetical protein [Halobacteriovorax sp. GB3]MDD0853257.1 hypothetical protein [Halobacteriovorax sp. GB3]
MKDQVAYDLDKAISQFNDPKKGLRILSSKMQIHEKTLKRLIQGENKPGHQTLYKIYRVLTDSKNDSELLDLVSPIIRDTIEKKSFKPLDQELIYTLDIEQEMIRDRAFSEIFFLAATGPLTKEFITFRYGEHGLETLKKMIKLGAIEVQQDGTLILGKARTNLRAESIKQLSIQMLERFLRPEATDDNNENHMAIYCEGLNDEGYQEWINIDEQAYKKKIEIANNKNYQGHIRGITFQCVDKMNPGINS